MKRMHSVLASFFMLLAYTNNAQQTYVAAQAKIYNYSTFNQTKTLITPELESMSNAYSKAHVEYGKLPFNAGCEDCAEIIDQRTANTRFYVGNGTGGNEVYAHTSLNDLHYKNENGDWITIDHRLRPSIFPNIFSAPNQELPTEINLNNYSTSIQLNNTFNFTFNNNWKLSSNDIRTSLKPMKPLSHMVGEDGAVLFNCWQGVDIRHTFSVGTIKTDFVINNLSGIDVNSDYTIFSESISLPEGYNIIRDIYEGNETRNGNWIGDLIVVDEFGNEFARYERVVIYMENPSTDEQASLGATGEYAVSKIGNVVTISIYVKTGWLTDANRSFPIIIDPTVSGTPASITGTPLGSRYDPNFCVHSMNVFTPANTTLTTATVSLDVEALNGGCSPGGTNCAKNLTEVYISTSCGVDPIGAPGIIYGCSPPGGICAVAGHLVLPNTGMPHLVKDCFTPSCASYAIPFNVHLQRNGCVNTDPLCDIPCIQLDDFDVTIKGKTVEATATAGGGASYTVLDCTDQSDWLAPDVDMYGVPDYTYSWSPIGATEDSIYVIFPMGVTVYTVTITDACGNTATDAVTVTNNCLLLPIALMSFNGYHENMANHLLWVAESNNAGAFIIERSFTGIDFVQVGTVNQLHGSGVNTYTFIDNELPNTLAYYRLKQIDINNNAQYSDIIAIKAGASATGSLALGGVNAANNTLSLALVSPIAGTCVLSIYDVNGKTVFANTVNAGEGSTLINLVLPELSKGTYIVAIALPTGVVETKFVY